jgi:aryl-phospho-beta-D-glucosidase BglC (GH1 family)
MTYSPASSFKPLATTVPSPPKLGRRGLGLLLLLAAAGCDSESTPASLAAGGTSAGPSSRAEPQDELIDDLEDGDLRFLYLDGSGRWLTGGAQARAGLDGGDNEAGATPALAVGRDGADTSARALHVSLPAPASRTGVAAVLSPPDAAQPLQHDYSSCSGIELWARLDSAATAEASSVTVTVESASGAGSADISLTEQWQRFELGWEELTPSPLSRIAWAGAQGGAGPEQDAAAGTAAAGAQGGAGAESEPATAGSAAAGAPGGAAGNSGSAAGAAAAGAPGGAAGNSGLAAGFAGASLEGGASSSGAGGAGGASGASGSPNVANATEGGRWDGAGGAGPLDTTKIVSIRVHHSSSLDVWVDQLKLKSCTLRSLTRPIPDPPALGSAGPEGTPVARHGQLRVASGRVLDQSGSPVQLKGMSSMWLNWEEDGYAENKEGLRWLRDNWNLSVIRAAMGVEPQGGYLSDPAQAKRQVRTIVQNAIDLGVYVIIDWHAHDAPSHRQEAQAFFAEMARQYGNAPNVIYEPFNEPREHSWSEELKPYHEAIITSIRLSDPDNLIVLGTPQWSQLVGHAARDPVLADNILYTLHFYSCTHPPSLRDEADAARARGLALFVTEWGATDADGGRDGVVCEKEARPWLLWMRQRRISWAAWKFDDCRPDSTCILAPNAPLDGGWTDELLYGHAFLVREWMLREQ